MRKRKVIYFIGTSKEMSEVLSECQGTDSSPHLCSLFNLHCLDTNLRNCPISSANQEVTIGEDAEGFNTKGEVFAVGSHALVDGAFDVDFHEVSGGGAAIDEFVFRVDYAGAPFSF